MRPLDDIKVIEVASWMAVPSTGALLADLGADVVKVEPLDGDPARGMVRMARRIGKPPIDSSFHADNRGKRSIAIALDEPEGAEIVRCLIERADVFVSNLLPRRQVRFGLDPKTLLRRQPKLVHATFTGFGVDGPDAERPGYDVTAFFGRGGITEAMREPGGVAPQPRPAHGDHTAALALASGILAALRLVQRSGRGQVIDSSLLATAAWTMTTDLCVTLIDGLEPTKRDRRHLFSATANRFRCRDDRWLVLNMPEVHWWPKLCSVLDHPEWVDDQRFASPRLRFDNMPALIDAIDAAFLEHDLAVWAPRLDAGGLIWAPAATLVEVAADPHAAAIDLFPELVVDGEAVRTVGVPFRIDGATIAPGGPAPAVGADTRAVLRALLDERSILDLVDRGVVKLGREGASA